jgi:hypothetical protein
MRKPTNRKDALPAREPQPTAPPLQEPRPAAWSDLVAAGRRWLLHEWDSEPTPTRVRPPWQFENGAGPAFAKVEKYIDATAAPHGPYSVDPDVTNDDMGYGERIGDELLHVGDTGKATLRGRVRQRTKTGWQLLTPARGSRAPADSPAQLDAPRLARATTRTPAKAPRPKPAARPRASGTRKVTKRAE